MRRIWAVNIYSTERSRWCWKLRFLLFYLVQKKQVLDDFCLNNSSSKQRQRPFFSLHSFECTQKSVHTRFIFSRSFCGPLKMHFEYRSSVRFVMCDCACERERGIERVRVCSLYLCTVCMTMVHREICIRLCRLLDYLLLSLFLHTFVKLPIW